MLRGCVARTHSLLQRLDTAILELTEEDKKEMKEASQKKKGAGGRPKKGAGGPRG